MQIDNLTRRGRPIVNCCIDRYFPGVQYQTQNHQKTEDAQVILYYNFSKLQLHLKEVCSGNGLTAKIMQVYAGQQSETVSAIDILLSLMIF